MSLGARWLGPSRDVIVLLSSAGILIRLGASRVLAYIPLPKALNACLQLTLYYAELYEYRSRRRTELFQQLGQSLAIATVGLAFIFFAVPGLEVGRGIFFLFILFAWSGLLLWRLLLLWTWSTLGAFGDRVLILGTGVPAQKVAREMLKRAPIGYPCSDARS
jgi:FlaA1/EpsC-like NDP-sugar epimerase